jgi:hypothetical protein
MELVTVVKEVYKYSELSDSAKSEASEWYQSTLDYDWWDSTYYHWVCKLSELGFDATTQKYKTRKDDTGYYQTETLISFSGFYSQGDGASFTGTVNVREWIKVNNPSTYSRLAKLMDKGIVDISGVIKRDRWHNYVHWNTTSLYMDIDIYGRLGWDATNVLGLIKQLEEDILKHHQELNKEIYRDLEKEWDYLCSEESVEESCEANDWRFLEDGALFRG